MYRTLIAALALSWLSVTAYAQNDLVISNVRVFTGQEQIEKASIVVNGGKITEISAAPATGRVLIDGEGKTALPGLIDSHAHIFAATAGVTEAETRDFIRTKLQERLLAMLRHGVTTVKSLGDPTDIILQVRRDLREGRLAGPRMLVVGPIFTAVDGHPATSPVCQGDSWCRSTTAAEVATEADARRIVGRLADQGVDGIKIVYAGGVREGIEMKKLAKPVMEAIVDESRKRGLRATAHVVDEPSSLEVLAAGAWGIEHGPSEPLTSNALIGALMKPARSYTPTLYGNTRNNPALFQVKARTVAEAYKAGVRIIAASDVSVHLTAQDGSQEIRIFVSDPRYGPNAIENLVAVALHELGHIWCCQGPSASDDGHWLVATPDPELTGVDRFGLMNHPVRCLVFGVVWSCPNRFSRRELAAFGFTEIPPPPPDPCIARQATLRSQLVALDTQLLALRDRIRALEAAYPAGMPLTPYAEYGAAIGRYNALVDQRNLLAQQLNALLC